MKTVLVVAIGGACGAALRYLLANWFEQLIHKPFPAGTMIVNIIGSLIIGILFVLATERGQWPELVRLAIITGLLGGFTTFSAFSLDTLLLLQQGRLVATAGYLLGSVGVCLLAAWLGMSLARMGGV